MNTPPIMLDNYRHDLRSDVETLCGIKADEHCPAICCDCNHPNCEYKLTCPCCIAIASKKVN